MTLPCNAGRLPFGQSTPAFAVPTSTRDQSHGVAGQPPYNIASVDLSGQWIDLVKQGKVEATVRVSQQQGTEVSVKYGVRLVEKKDKTLVCEEFVEEADLEPGQSNGSELVRSINKTLATLQSEEVSTGPPVKFILDGDFAAQLQLVRTLRPAPSAGFSGATSSIPPDYDPTTDSFVTGPLRLELRPKVASLFIDGMKTPWDVFHNVSPADTRGHFLLLPTLSDKIKNWRGQIFTKDDCNDLVYLTSSIDPVGSLFLGYNSVGGAASQNHIHCHAWPCPPIPLQNKPKPVGGHHHDDDDDHHHNHHHNDDDATTSDLVDGWDCYAVSRLDSMYDFFDVDEGKVEVSYLKYPVFCVQLSASDQNLALLGKSLAAILEAIGELPHNIGFLNRLQVEEDTDELQKYTDVYIFARSKERSTVLPTLKLGISEMMGVFHAQSDQELEQLAGKANEKSGPMYQALEDISYDEEVALWDSIKENLSILK